MKHFEKIGQFRDVIRCVRDQHDFQGLDENGKAIMNHETPYPTITFTGTVKLHGTNSGVDCKFIGWGYYRIKDDVSESRSTPMKRLWLMRA